MSGTAAAVSAAFATPLESVQAPDQARALVNTASPQIPAALAGSVTAVVGLDGLFQEHSMLRPAPASHPGGRRSDPAPSAAAGGADPAPSRGRWCAAEPRRGPCRHAPGRAPPPPGSAFGGAYTSTQIASIFGLDQLFAQGRTGIGQTIAVVEFEQYLSSDFQTFESCYGLSNPIRNVIVDGGPGGPPQGQGEAALDTEIAAFNAPSASLVVYEAPNDNDAQALDLFNQIASDDVAQVVTTSWGNCEATSARPTCRRRTDLRRAWPCRGRP